jgi:hypothetical protein
MYKKSIVNDIYVFSRSMILKLFLFWSNITLVIFLCIIVIIIILFFILYKYKKFVSKIRLNEQIVSGGCPRANAPPSPTPIQTFPTNLI